MPLKFAMLVVVVTLLVVVTAMVVMGSSSLAMVGALPGVRIEGLMGHISRDVGLSFALVEHMRMVTTRGTVVVLPGQVRRQR